MPRHKFTICAIIDFDIDLPESNYFKDEEWPQIYRKGVEELIAQMYNSRANASVTLMPNGVN